MSLDVLEKVKAHLGDAVLSSHNQHGDETVVIKADAIRETILWLRDTPGLQFDMLSDLTAVDYLEQDRTPRFEIVYHLYSVSKKHRLRVKIGIEESLPEADTLCDIYGNANWCEREIWDLYGITFRDHPDMRRILLYEEFEGHPLRKDYRKDRRQPLVRRPKKELEDVVLGRGVGNKRSLI